MKKPLLIIDFGHGTRQYTRGKCSPDHSLYEGEWNREVGKMIASGMRECGVEVVLVADTDQDTPLRERCRIVNDIVAKNPGRECLFLSVHINAAGGDGQWHDATGWSVWISRNASARSLEMAQSLYKVALKLGLKGNRATPPEMAWRSDFAVLKGTRCPAVLTENLFMDNRSECRLLLSPEGKEKLANLHIMGLCDLLHLPYVLINRSKPAQI